MNAVIFKTDIDGVCIIDSKSFVDERGLFLKTFHAEFFKKNNLAVDFKEEYYSISNKNVIRGMHFQTPPFDLEKLVYCIKGSVMDVLIDLRKKSATYNKYITIDLNGSDGKIVYIPKGVAHGFCSLEDDTVMMYKVTSVYNSESDKGILWDSFGLKWPIVNPVVSSRDLSFPSLEKFNSPF